jgi:hypothetical protein
MKLSPRHEAISQVGEHVGGLGVDGRIILKWIFNRVCEKNLSDSQYGPASGSCKYGNEISVSIKVRNFFTR